MSHHTRISTGCGDVTVAVASSACQGYSFDNVPLIKHHVTSYTYQYRKQWHHDVAVATFLFPYTPPKTYTCQNVNTYFPSDNISHLRRRQSPTTTTAVWNSDLVKWMLYVAEPASCDDTPLPQGDKNGPVKAEHYSVLSKHDEQPPMSGTCIQHDCLPGKLSVAVCCQYGLLTPYDTKNCT